MKKYVEAEYGLIHYNDGVEMRLIGDEVIMYSQLTLKQMKQYRDFLNEEIEKRENAQ